MEAKLLLYYLVGINLLSVGLFYLDKRRARLHQWRIKESLLLGLALAGGSLGAWCGMKLFRHKNRHIIFAWGILVVLALQLGILFYFRIL